MGQPTMNSEEANKLIDFLELQSPVADALQEYPLKGSLDETLPVDPLIYRFHEFTQVYGTTIKAVIQENLVMAL